MITTAEIPVNEALQWREEIGLPALEKVEQLTIKLNYYINQEFIYKSQLELVQNELNDQTSSIISCVSTKDDIIMETQSHLQHISLQNSYLVGQLDTMEYLHENTETLNLKIKQLQKRNIELEESNQTYIQINHRLIEEQISSNKNISNLNSEKKKLNERLSHMMDMFQANEHKYRSVIENTILEKEQYIKHANVEYDKCLHADMSDLHSDADLPTFKMERTLVNPTNVHLSDDMTRALAIKDSSSSANSESDGIFSPKIYRFLSEKSNVILSPGFTSVQSGYYSEADLFAKKGRKDDEKKNEEEIDVSYIENINIYEMEIEALKDKLCICERELCEMGDKYKQCERSLFSMNMQYDKLYDELQQSKDVSGALDLFIYCAK